jgi:PAS domain S-box-containing protein
VSNQRENEALNSALETEDPINRDFVERSARSAGDMMRLGGTKKFVRWLAQIRLPDAPGSAADGGEGLIACEQLNAFREALDRVAIVAVTDVRGRIVDVNEKFCAVSGYGRDELIGSTHSLLNSGCHPRSFFEDLWKTISTGRVWRSDICNRAKSGSLYWVDTTIAPLRDAVGRLRGYVSIRYDITDRKIAEERALLEALRRQDSELLLAGLTAGASADASSKKTE